MNRIIEIKARIESFLELEGQLVTAGPSKGDAIIKSQSLIEEHYYADVSDLLDLIGSALYSLERLEKVLDMPERGYVRNGYNAVVNTLKGEYM